MKILIVFSLSFMSLTLHAQSFDEMIERAESLAVTPDFPAAVYFGGSVGAIYFSHSLHTIWPGNREVDTYTIATVSSLPTASIYSLLNRCDIDPSPVRSRGFYP